MAKSFIKKDGHIHSPYCPHGTKDAMVCYIERALALGFEEMTFTEHMPLPDGVVSPEIQRESALTVEEVGPYFDEIEDMKKKYQGKIQINKGLEVDYIEGYEKSTKSFLNLYGKDLEDGILSVHILKIKDQYYSVDMSLEEFEKIVGLAGGVDKIYDCYFETLLKAISSDLGPFKPKRIGHPTLVRIFNKRYPLEYKNKVLLEAVVKAIKERHYQIDFNTAGLRKPFCHEIYPSDYFLELIKKYEVEAIYGSDAHRGVDLGEGYGAYEKYIKGLNKV